LIRHGMTHVLGHNYYPEKQSGLS